MEPTMETQLHLEADLHCAAFVLARGFPLLGLERSGKRYLFEFAPEAVEAAHEYAENALIPARDYADAIARLKNSLYSEKFKESRNENRNGNVYRNYSR
jgi:hypothetical protein